MTRYVYSSFFFVMGESIIQLTGVVIALTSYVRYSALSRGKVMSHCGEPNVVSRIVLCVIEIISTFGRKYDISQPQQVCRENPVSEASTN